MAWRPQVAVANGNHFFQASMSCRNPYYLYQHRLAESAILRYGLVTTSDRDLTTV